MHILNRNNRSHVTKVALSAHNTARKYRSKNTTVTYSLDGGSTVDAQKSNARGTNTSAILGAM